MNPFSAARCGASIARRLLLLAASAAALVICLACSSHAPALLPSLSRTLIPGYDVGVTYNAYTSNFTGTEFINIYQYPDVRAAVRAQVQGMADRGATVLTIPLWFAHDPTNAGLEWESTFPMSDQEEANLRAYAQDVAAVQGLNGHRLRLTVSFNWDDASDLTVGSPSTGLGNGNYAAADYISRVQLSTDKVLAAVGDVKRPDGVRLVDTIYLATGDVFGTPNADWFMTSMYPRFVSVVSQAGFQPSIYFSVCCKQAEVLDESYVDPQYPILNKHRSVAPMYRDVKFLVDHGLYVPPRIDFGYYIRSTGATYSRLLTRVLDDADATLPSLGAAKAYGIAETFYPADGATRRQFGQAFADEAAARSRLKRVSFWTTPGSGLNGESAGYPFAIGDYLYP